MKYPNEYPCYFMSNYTYETKKSYKKTFCIFHNILYFCVCNFTVS